MTVKAFVHCDLVPALGCFSILIVFYLYLKMHEHKRWIIFLDVFASFSFVIFFFFFLFLFPPRVNFIYFLAPPSRPPINTPDVPRSLCIAYLNPSSYIQEGHSTLFRDLLLRSFLSIVTLSYTNNKTDFFVLFLSCKTRCYLPLVIFFCF